MVRKCKLCGRPSSAQLSSESSAGDLRCVTGVIDGSRRNNKFSLSSYTVSVISNLFAHNISSLSST